MGRMPVCYFFQKFGECNNKDCQFMHVDADTLKVKDCPWYDRGFCKHGPACRNRHTRRVICQKYLYGFCPDGAVCTFVHPRYELPGTKTFPIYHSSAIFGNLNNVATAPVTTVAPISTASDMTVIPPTSTQQQPAPPPNKPGFVRRPLHEVTCFKCGEKGHYANMCPKSYRAMQMGLVNNQQPNVGVK
jgi:cleavage and polyadenylation specificity factor subunit 4